MNGDDPSNQCPDFLVMEAELARLSPAQLSASIEQRIIDKAVVLDHGRHRPFSIAKILFPLWMSAGAAAALIIAATAWAQLSLPPPSPSPQQIAAEKQRLAFASEMIASLRSQELPPN